MGGLAVGTIRHAISIDEALSGGSASCITKDYGEERNCGLQAELSGSTAFIRSLAVKKGSDRLPRVSQLVKYEAIVATKGALSLLKCGDYSELRSFLRATQLLQSNIVEIAQLDELRGGNSLRRDEQRRNFARTFNRWVQQRATRTLPGPLRN